MKNKYLNSKDEIKITKFFDLHFLYKTRKENIIKKCMF